MRSHWRLGDKRCPFVLLMTHSLLGLLLCLPWGLLCPFLRTAVPNTFKLGKIQFRFSCQLMILDFSFSVSAFSLRFLCCIIALIKLVIAQNTCSTGNGLGVLVFLWCKLSRQTSHNKPYFVWSLFIIWNNAIILLSAHL
jgi:hypothetical protein